MLQIINKAVYHNVIRALLASSNKDLIRSFGIFYELLAIGEVAMVIM